LDDALDGCLECLEHGLGIDAQRDAEDGERDEGQDLAAVEIGREDGGVIGVIGAISMAVV
jgi:hypothetical protein